MGRAIEIDALVFGGAATPGADAINDHIGVKLRGDRGDVPSENAERLARQEYRAMQTVAIEELEEKLARDFRIERHDVHFLNRFADRRFQGRFVRFDFAARRIDLTRAQTTLFVDQQNASAFYDKAEIGP